MEKIELDFYFLRGVINFFVAELIYHKGKVSINFLKDSLNANEAIFPQSKTADTINYPDVSLIQQFLRHFFAHLSVYKRLCNYQATRINIKISCVIH